MQVICAIFGFEPGAALPRWAALITLGLAVILPVSALAGPADRYEASLSGSWSFAPHDGIPPGTPIGDIDVPSFWDLNPTWVNVTHATYSRVFDVPAQWDAHRVILHFGAVSFRAVVRLNGVSLGTHDGDGTPFEYDVTSVVDPVGNALEVEVFDQEVVNSVGFYTYPIGLPVRPGSIPPYLGICQDVSLLAVPLVHVSDIHVIPRVSTGELDVNITVRNDDSVDHDVAPHTDILDASVVVETLNVPAAVPIAAGTSHTFSITHSWPTAVRWWPDSPQLYDLRVEVHEAESILDTKSDTRFGYREATILGNQYQLNGLRLNLRGETTVYPKLLFDDRPTIEAQVARWKAIGINVVRYHTQPPPPLFVEIADEMGLLVIAESSVYCSDENLALFDPNFWQNARDHIAEWVPRDRNHPSIVNWSVANECLYKSLPPGFTTADLLSLETELRLYDDSLPVIYDGDGAIGGLAATRNKHYPSSIAHLEDDGASHAYTNWYSLDPYWMDGVSLDKPTGIGEWMFNKSPSSNPNSIYYPRNWGRVKAMMIRGYRNSDLADIRPFTVGQEGLNSSARYTYPMFAASFAANAVFDREHDDLWADLYAPGSPPPALNEATVSIRDLIVYNEDLSDAPDDQIQVTWRTQILGQTIDSGSFDVTVAPGQHVEQQISMPVPGVDEDTPFLLVLNARKGGELVFEDRRAFLAVDTGAATSGASGVLTDGFELDSPNDVWSYFDTGWDRIGTLSATETTMQQSVAALDHYTFDDLTLEFEVRITNGAGWAGMSFRRVRPEDYHWESGYTVFLRSNGNVALYDSDVDAVIAEASTGGTGTDVRSVRIEATGAQIKVIVDGSLILDHTDTSNPITAAGYVGFIKNPGATAEFGDVRVAAGFLPYDVPALGPIGLLLGTSLILTFAARQLRQRPRLRLRAPACHRDP